MKTRIVQNEPNDRAPADQAVTQRDSAVDHAGSAPPPELNRFRGFVRRYELVIFFALTYLIAWSTLPFGTFGAYAPIVSAVVVCPHRRGLAGAGSDRSASHSMARELDLVRGCHRPAATGPRGGDRSEHGGRRTCTLRSPVPAVVRSAVAVRPPNGQFHRWAAWERSQPGAASRSHDCNRSGHPLASAALLGATDHRLAHATGLHAAVRPRIPGHSVDRGGHVLVRLVVQPDRRQCAAAAHRACDRGLRQHPGSVAGGSRCRPRGVDVVDRLGSARDSPVDLRSEVLAYGTRVGNRSGAWPNSLIRRRAVPSSFTLCMACMPCTA